ncbi:MAG: hypothetical protein L0958_00715 [Candidatus Mariimomonas ferrooxydans]
MKEVLFAKKIEAFEEIIIKLVNKIKAVNDENKALNIKIKKLQEELQNKSIKQDSATVDKLKVQIDRFNIERKTARAQVEDLIEELESVEL